MRTWHKLASLVACGLMIWTGPASADTVTDWNEIAQAAIATGRPGPTGVLDSALVQIAVHDAVQAIDRRFEPYFFEMKGAKGSRRAAVAAAAHDVLVGLYHDQADNLDTLYFNYLANNGLGSDPGLVVGQKAAAALLPLGLTRQAPVPAPPDFIGGTNPGEWRPTESFIGNPPVPPSGSPMMAPYVAALDPYTLTGPTRFRAQPPPALDSALYTKDFNEVKRLGSFGSTERTDEQKDIAYFYSENFLAQWNRALRAIAINHLDGTGDSARLFALANMAMADAFITAWDSKKFHDFWRPLTAIREAANDGNPDTEADATWQPLINNPNYPDYTSGANNLTGAVTRTLSLYFGTDRFTWNVTSNAPLAVKKTRTYTRFSAAAQDVVDARVYLGIHFRFADTAARTQGQRVAEWAFNHFLLPLHDDDDDHHGRNDDR
jgi:hypothetical protein